MLHAFKRPARLTNRVLKQSHAFAGRFGSWVATILSVAAGWHKLGWGLEIRADRGELTGAKPSLQHSHPVAISSIETFRRSFHRMGSRQAKIL